VEEEFLLDLLLHLEVDLLGLQYEFDAPTKQDFPIQEVQLGDDLA
jgi:hypothetical protein